ncbi:MULTISPECIES: hypothetical protein [unclassified Lysinibacillus]|uniref:hypothetical protein n=1 Tax=unclassified Lysinibacillus TaxID=2636778 RepID=UPI00382595F2
MLEQNKVDKMNNAIAEWVIKRIEVLSPLASSEELESIAQLAKVVNEAPKTIRLTEVGVCEPLKPYKRKKYRKYKK